MKKIKWGRKKLKNVQFGEKKHSRKLDFAAKAWAKRDAMIFKMSAIKKQSSLTRIKGRVLSGKDPI